MKLLQRLQKLERTTALMRSRSPMEECPRVLNDAAGRLTENDFSSLRGSADGRSI
jgi:hypothetical protein